METSPRRVVARLAARCGLVLALLLQALVGVLVASPSTASADTPVLDQSFTAPSGLSSAINECCRYVAQTFTAGLSGRLAGVTVEIQANQPQPLEVAIRAAPGGVPGPTVLGRTLIADGSSGPSTLITFPTAIDVVAGRTYAIVVDYPTAPPAGAGQGAGSWAGAIGDAYPRGAMYLSTDGVAFGLRDETHLGFDVHFQTFVAAPATTPPPLLDAFNRADGGIGPSWTGATNTGTYRINSRQLEVRNSGYVYWNRDVFGPDQAARVTLRHVAEWASDQALLLKVNGIAPDGGTGGTASGNNWSVVEVQYDVVNGQVLVNTHVPYTTARPQWATHATFPLTLRDGDELGARALPNGTVQVFVNGALVGQSSVTQGPNAFPASLAAGGGRVGLWVIGATYGNPSVLDDFGGGSVAP